MRSWTQTRHWLRQQAQSVEDNRGGSTLLEIVGRERLVIERHRGIQCYGNEEIQVRATFGHIQISGAGLKLCCMSREQLCITGRIDEVKLMGRAGFGAVE